MKNNNEDAKQAFWLFTLANEDETWRNSATPRGMGGRLEGEYDLPLTVTLGLTDFMPHTF